MFCSKPVTSDVPLGKIWLKNFVLLAFSPCFTPTWVPKVVFKSSWFGSSLHLEVAYDDLEAAYGDLAATYGDLEVAYDKLGNFNGVL